MPCVSSEKFIFLGESIYIVFHGGAFAYVVVGSEMISQKEVCVLRVIGWSISGRDLSQC